MWQAIDKHPGTGILIWVIYAPNLADLPNLTLLELARYDSWNCEFRLIKYGKTIGNIVCWQKCQIPLRPSQIEIDKKFT